MTTKRKSRLSRKRFIKWIVQILLLPIIYLIDSTVVREIEKNSHKKKIVLPVFFTEGINFIDTVILYKKGDLIKVFSSRCTHLGCTINKIENDSLICPCHGSQFSFDGFVIKGPASKSLEELKINIDNMTGKKYVYA